MIRWLAALCLGLMVAIFISTIVRADSQQPKLEVFRFASGIDFVTELCSPTGAARENIVIFDPPPNNEVYFPARCFFDVVQLEFYVTAQLPIRAHVRCMRFGLFVGIPFRVVEIAREAIWKYVISNSCPATAGRSCAEITPHNHEGISDVFVRLGIEESFPVWLILTDVRPQLALGTILGDSVGPESGGDRHGRDEDGYDKGYDLANRGEELLFHPFDSLVSRISHASLFAKVSFIAALWAIAIGAIYASGGCLGYYGWRNTRGR